MKRTLLILLPLAVACSQQPVEQPLEGQELINKFSGYWKVYNVESGEYEFNYWVIDPSGLCYLACDEGFNEGKLVSDYNSGIYQANQVHIETHAESGGYWENEDRPLGGIKASRGKFYYTISLQPRIKGWNRNDLAYSGTYIDSLDIWTNKGWSMEADNVYSGGVYELRRMKR